MSLPLPVQGTSIGALNIYSRTPDAFDDTSVEIGSTVAGYVAVAVANARDFSQAAAVAEQMRAAMGSRATIEQAKGILVSQRGCTPEDAFDILVRASKNANRKLREIAESLVEKSQRG